VLTLGGTAPTLTGAGVQPEVLSTGSGSAGAGTAPGTTRAGAQPEVLTTGNQQTEKEEAR
ncbi:hypothetical protein G3V82_23860, partial [Escherichia coli]|nr:hypothetical protein [Escherichia coli]